MTYWIDLALVAAVSAGLVVAVLRRRCGELVLDGVVMALTAVGHEVAWRPVAGGYEVTWRNSLGWMSRRICLGDARYAAALLASEFKRLK